MAKAVWTDSQVINQLDSGSHWSGSSLTYGFPTTASWFPYSEKNTFSALNGSQQTAATMAIKLWDDLMAPDFSLAANGATANIKYSNTTTNIGYAHAYYPGGWAGAGSVWFNSSYGAGSGTNNLITPTVGNWGFQTFVHETGHALGLDHPGTYNGGSPTYTNDALYAQDSQMYTVMSYFTADNTGADWYASDGRWYYPQTPMLHDVMAIQSMYGVETTTRTGNTTYGFNATADVWLYDFTQNRHPVLCIFDSAGTDTIDLSGWSYSCSLNLTPGTFSNCDMMTYNISIAQTSWIENGIGGGGADTITGNDLANVLTGLAGNDTINGGLGADTIYGGDNNDTLTGGAGNDIIDGGNGTDSARYSGSSTFYTATWDAGLSAYFITDLRGGSPDGTDRVSAVESFIFADLTLSAANLLSSLAPATYGTNAAEAMQGTAGTDRIYGMDAADSLYGLAGDDMLSGDGGDDLLTGGAGADFLTGGTGADTFVFARGFGADTIGDFTAGAGLGDRISLTGFTNIRSLSNALAYATQSGNDTVFDFGNGDTLRLQNVLKTALVADDFVFGPTPYEDFDRDGDSDILMVRSADGALTIQHVSDRMAQAVVAAGQIGVGQVVRGSGDVDRDGDADLVVSDAGGTIGIYSFEGGQSPTYSVFAVVGANWHVVGLGDTDRDGDADMFIRNVDGTIGLYLIEAGQMNSFSVVARTGTEWRVSSVADFDRDGDADLQIRRTDGTFGIYEMENGQVRAYSLVGRVGSEWNFVGNADFDRDGDADILIQRGSDGLMGIYEIENRELRSFAFIGQTGANARVAGVGDYDRDGDADIMTHDAAGNIGIYEIELRQIQSFSSLASTTSDWHIV